MTTPDGIGTLDRARLREVFDLRNAANIGAVGGYEEDPYPRWRELRELSAVHPGTLHELTGYHGEVLFQGLPFADRPHFSAFTFAACDEALRNQEVFASSSVAVDLDGGPIEPLNSIFSMAGAQHRRYRKLVAPSFVPPRMRWWIQRWIDTTVHALIDWFIEDGRADLNVDFCAALPVLTITGSFGVAVEQAIAIREALGHPERLVRLLAPIIAARRASGEDDLISVLVEAEVQDEDGKVHRLSDAEIYSFAVLLLLAGSGTTWRQMGIVLSALLARSEVLDAVRRDRRLLGNAIEESLRWMPTNPMFSRFVTTEVEFHGARLPKGALLDRLPNLSLDPDAEPPRIIGMYHRGPTAIPVRFG